MVMYVGISGVGECANSSLVTPPKKRKFAHIREQETCSGFNFQLMINVFEQEHRTIFKYVCIG